LVTNSRECAFLLATDEVAKHSIHQQLVPSRSFDCSFKFRLFPSQLSRDQHSRSFPPLPRFLFSPNPPRIQSRRSRESRFTLVPSSILFTRRSTDDSERYTEVPWVLEDCRFVQEDGAIVDGEPRENDWEME